MAVIAAAHSSISNVIRNKCIDLVHYVLAKDCDRPTDELREKATALEATVFERFTDSELYKSRMRLAFVNLSDKNLQKFKNAVIDGVVHVNECLKSKASTHHRMALPGLMLVKGDLEGLEAILSAGTSALFTLSQLDTFGICTHPTQNYRYESWSRTTFSPVFGYAAPTRSLAFTKLCTERVH
ncbi:hypothetical protein B0H10DRAFT_2197292 [Mycena sp. CBHHK59/15]|nr:hypothetical protein B0H10DRAFT_2197292 [Mycena sp. CBHHK59/15]